MYFRNCLYYTVVALVKCIIVKYVSILSQILSFSYNLPHIPYVTLTYVQPVTFNDLLKVKPVV